MNKEIIDKTIAALRHNHFEVFFAHNTAEASAIFFRDIFPGLQVETVSWGDSETMKATGVLNELRKNPELSVIDSFAPGMSRKQKIYWRRQALLTDLFLTGSNALTQKGQLVNLDMIGNRVGGITFGPKHVVLFIGINKITANLEEAMHRVRTLQLPEMQYAMKASVPHATRPVYVWIVIAPTGFVTSGQLQKRVIRQAESKSF